MSSPYAQGLELLARIQEQLNNIKPRMTVQTLFAISENWQALKMAVIATGEVADKAVTASRQQHARYDYHANTAIYSGEDRKKLAGACLDHFRYVTALSDHARAVKTHHSSVLLAWTNFRAYYEGAPGPHAHEVHAHRKFLDDLECKIETIKRSQRLEAIYVRWLRLNATANLARQAEEFHFACKRIEHEKARAEKARRLADDLRKERNKLAREYERLESAMLRLEMDIEMAWDERVLGVGIPAAAAAAAAAAPAPDEYSDEMEQST